MELVGLTALAFVAGIVSFTSPCMVPLLPGYVAYVAGLDGSDDSRSMWLGVTLFVAGFGGTFVVLGLGATAVGFYVNSQTDVLDVIAGIVIALMGLVTLGAVTIPGGDRELRFDPSRIARGPAGAAPLGAAFAFGWTPCIGPVLAGILATSATQASFGRGVALLVAYTAGMAAPFLLVARAVHRDGTPKLRLLRRHSRRLQVAGGLVLITMGVAVASGSWTVLMSRMLAWYARVGWPPI